MSSIANYTVLLSIGFFKSIVIMIMMSASTAYSLGCPAGQIVSKNIYYNKFDPSSQLWVCYPDPNYKPAPAVAAQPAPVASTKSRTRSTTKKQAKPSSQASNEGGSASSEGVAASTEGSGDVQPQASVVSGGTSFFGGSSGCEAGYNRITTMRNDDFTPEVGDTYPASTNGGYTFCRKIGVSMADVNAAKQQAQKGPNGKEDCGTVNGTVSTRSGVQICKFFNRELGKMITCFIREDDGSLANCKTEKSDVADGGACEARFNDLVKACDEEAKKASTDCDQENAGIQEAMNATKAIGAGSAASVQLACSKLGQISKIANTSLLGWQSFCAYTQGTCESSCSEARKLYSQDGCILPANKPNYSGAVSIVQDNINSCVAYKKRISEAAQHAAAAFAQMQASKKCEEDTNSLTTASLDECKKNPNNPLCTDVQRCSNGDFAATNTVCKCINNPSSKDCLATTANAGSRGVAGGSPFGSSGSGANTDPASAFIPPSNNPGENPFATALRDGAVKNELNLGGAKGNAGLGGGGAGGGGGGGAAGSYGAGGPGGPDADKNKINSGFYGAAGGGAGGGYFGNRNGSGVGGRPTAGGVNYGKLSAGGAQFDPRRYIAGLNGKGGEYINGPSMDIFRIVKNRIESKKPTMLDPDFKK